MAEAAGELRPITCAYRGCDFETQSFTDLMIHQRMAHGWGARED